MNYRLQQQGQDRGVFALEELRRRQIQGELTGTELVQREGTTGWQALGAVLAEIPPAPAPPPLPVVRPPPVPPPVPPRPRTNRWVVRLAIIAAVIYLVGMGVMLLRMPDIMRLTGLDRWEPPAARTAAARRAAAHEAASQPVVIATNAVTEAKLKPQRRAFLERVFVQAYREQGERNPGNDARCLGLLENWVAEFYGGVRNTNLPPQAELAAALAADTNCTDPVVLTVAGIYEEDPEAKTRILQRAVAAFERSRYRAYPKFYAATTLAEYQDEETPESAKTETQAVHWFTEALHDGSLSPDQEGDIAEKFVAGSDWQFFEHHAAALAGAVKGAGPAFAWLALVLDAQNQLNLAWGIQRIKPDHASSWTAARKYERLMDQAEKELTAAWKLRPDLPQAPALAMNTALSRWDITKMREWFDRAVAARLDYRPAWSLMRWGLRPQCCGDTNAVREFGLVALRTRRFDTQVPQQFLDTIGDLWRDSEAPSAAALYGRADIWPHAQEMFEGYIAAPDVPSEQRKWWRSSYVAAAFATEHYDLAREQLEALHWQPMMRLFHGWGQDMSLLPEEVAARTGDTRAQVLLAENCRINGQPDEALKLYGTLDLAAEPDARVRQFVTDRRASMALGQRVRSHDWEDFMPTTTNLDGWCAAAGQWELQPDGSLQVQADAAGHLLFSRAIIGTSFEVKGEFEVLSNSAPEFQAGVVLGLPEIQGYGWYAFRIMRDQENKDTADFSTHWIRGHLIQPVKLVAGRNSFTLQYLAGQVNVSVNGDAVLTNTTAPPNRYLPRSGEFFVGLGGASNGESTVIRYSHVQLRRL